LPWAYWRLWLCQQMGWSLEYVDALDMWEAYEMIDMMQSAELARAHERKKARRG
jgi:hypothetical protein